jgi:hypothetical protein
MCSLFHGSISSIVTYNFVSHINYKKAINLLQLVDFNEIKMALQNGHHLMQQLRTFNSGGLKTKT